MRLLKVECEDYSDENGSAKPRRSASSPVPNKILFQSQSSDKEDDYFKGT